MLARLILRLLGWKIEGTKPSEPKYVALVAPHTSNWDFFYTIMMAYALNVRVMWFGKEILFKGIQGRFLRLLGGIPVQLDTNMADFAVEEFNKRDEFVLGIAPEGALKKVDFWRTGFYYIANNANVPILTTFIDYKRKVVGAGPMVYPSGEIHKDISVFREFYAGVIGKHPEKMGEIRVRSERMETN